MNKKHIWIIISVLIFSFSLCGCSKTENNVKDYSADHVSSGDVKAALEESVEESTDSLAEDSTKEDSLAEDSIKEDSLVEDIDDLPEMKAIDKLTSLSIEDDRTIYDKDGITITLDDFRYSPNEQCLIADISVVNNNKDDIKLGVYSTSLAINGIKISSDYVGSIPGEVKYGYSNYTDYFGNDFSKIDIQTITISFLMQIGTEGDTTVWSKEFKTNYYVGNEKDYGEKIAETTVDGETVELYRKDEENHTFYIIKSDSSVLLDTRCDAGFGDVRDVSSYGDMTQCDDSFHLWKYYATLFDVDDKKIKSIRKLYGISNDEPVVIFIGIRSMQEYNSGKAIVVKDDEVEILDKSEIVWWY